MLTHYLVLGVKPPSSHEEIRRKYLSLIRVFTPESAPNDFVRINQAYESLKSERHRVNMRIFGCHDTVDWEAELKNLAQSLKIKKRSPTLSELIEAEKMTATTTK
jgi:curved DNA-binding protein CbpA